MSTLNTGRFAELKVQYANIRSIKVFYGQKNAALWQEAETLPWDLSLEETD